MQRFGAYGIFKHGAKDTGFLAGSVGFRFERFTMKDFIYIASSPCDEDCAQVGRPGYLEENMKECRALINQLRREKGMEPEGARLRIKREYHDFGPYWQVVCDYEIGNEKAEEYAFDCEDTPEKWDEEAKKELGILPPHPIA